MPDQVAVPPHNLEAERSVLGAILLDERHLAVARLDERLAPEDFYRDQHAEVFRAMCELQDAEKPIDVLTVTHQMQESGTGHEGTQVMVDELAGWVPAAGHAREYARIVHSTALKRDLLLMSYEVQAGVLDNEPITQLMDDAEKRMLSIAGSNASGGLAITDPEEEFNRLASVRDGVEVVGLSSGFMDLDKVTSGFQPSGLTVVAARPGMGKSALVVNMAQHIASKGTPVALFSLEMSRAEILRRMLAVEARVPGDSLLRGPITPDRWARIEKAVPEVAAWPLYVDESVDAGIIDIRAKARRLAQRVKLGLVIVDYIGLMRADAHAENRNIEVGKITRGLKVLAKELSVPVIAVSQLSRAVEQRVDKRPQLSDLRDSGSVEQDADVVMFLYREGYYDDECAEPEVTELNIAKHRNGPLGKVKLTFLDRYPRFANYASEQQAFSAGVPTTGPVNQAGEPTPF